MVEHYLGTVDHRLGMVEIGHWFGMVDFITWSTSSHG